MISGNSVLGLIREQALKHGDRIAVISDGKSMTYGDMWRSSDGLAAYLDDRLKEEHGPVMVYGHKDPQMLSCFLGCAKSGRAYCPVDISMPKSRIEEIAGELGCPLVLATEELTLDGAEVVNACGVVNKLRGASHAGGPLSVLFASGKGPSNAAPAHDAAAPAEGDDTFYIIFTSGSTGKPKGVEISERALRNYLNWSSAMIEESLEASEATGGGTTAAGGPDAACSVTEPATAGGTGAMELTAAEMATGVAEPATGGPRLTAAELAATGGPTDVGTVFLNQAPFSFDLSVMDTYNSLITGGTLLCMPKYVQEDMGKAFAYMKAGKPKVWVSTPSFADMCLADRLFCGEFLDELRLFLFCGERLTKETAAKLSERFPKAKIVNTYGPTESTVCVTWCEIKPEMLGSAGLLPIGVPKNGTEILLDGEEMIITGDTLAKGYFNDPEKTKKAFIQVKGKNGRPARGYRTGDSGYAKDGLYYCTGRIDKQIKLHGYRIELGDVEANLEAIDGVSQAVCVPHEENEKVRYIAAFVRRSDDADGEPSPAGSGPLPAEKEPSPAGSGPLPAEDRQAARELKKRLKDRLPAYMAPRLIIFTDDFPVTSGGKLDREKLKERLKERLR